MDGKQNKGVNGKRDSRRGFLKGLTTASAALLSFESLDGATHGKPSDGVSGFDHVAVPMKNTEEMVPFYRALGFKVIEGKRTCSVHFGDQKINFHRPDSWKDKSFTLRAPAAVPPCGDFCFVWDGSMGSLTAMLASVKAEVIEGPAERRGGRDGGNVVGMSLYVRDPDDNLLEFIVYS